MRYFLITSALAFSLTAPVIADKKQDMATFKEAYAAYKEAIKTTNSSQRYHTAKAAYEAGLKAFGDEHKNTANLALNYAQAANGAHKKDEAKKALKITEKLYLNIYGDDAPELIDVYIEKAQASINVFEDQRQGRRYYNKALNLTLKHYEKDSFAEGLIRKEIGNILLYEAQTTNALKYLKKAKEILSKHGNQGIVELAETNLSLGKYYLGGRKYKKATTSLNASLDVYNKYAPSASVTLSNHAFLIQAYEEQGMSEKATQHCRAIGSMKPRNPNQDFLPVYRVGANYPANAARAGREGYAILELTVDENGFVQQPKVLEVEGSDSFGAAAIKAAQKFRYAPRFENGKAVATEGVKYRFSFNLAN